MTKNIMIVGVGGQGSLLASKMLGKLLLSQGYDVKVSEVHGMSQRGGSVVTYVRYGEKVYSPVIDKGTADFIIAFEGEIPGATAKECGNYSDQDLEKAKIYTERYKKELFGKKKFEYK